MDSLTKIQLFWYSKLITSTATYLLLLYWIYEFLKFVLSPSGMNKIFSAEILPYVALFITVLSVGIISNFLNNLLKETENRSYEEMFGLVQAYQGGIPVRTLSEKLGYSESNLEKIIGRMNAKYEKAEIRPIKIESTSRLVTISPPLLPPPSWEESKGVVEKETYLDRLESLRAQGIISRETYDKLKREYEEKKGG